MTDSNKTMTPVPQPGAGGSAHGGEHWLHERLTSAALLLLGLWLVISLMLLPAFDRLTLTEWLRGPSGAIPMALLVILAFTHSVDGFNTVIDDYVQDEGSGLLLRGLLLFAAVGAGALALFSLAKIAFGA